MFLGHVHGISYSYNGIVVGVMVYYNGETPMSLFRCNNMS